MVVVLMQQADTQQQQQQQRCYMCCSHIRLVACSTRSGTVAALTAPAAAMQQAVCTLAADTHTCRAVL